ncbi:hypothetical protein BDK51DRAFT_33616 [Blyttiomyces helicus]|uniref:Uncharacterized protein n=1 Tax=Blyttiomyces helicus TaxID=388810 RepID=A0A4P9WAJ9_9FUNG|nr:hypothetical protein BDK51DRAFT_33616 [Blyttiomyces helicus]|eukprot:RKO88178.1 hypothetical protein BDK51DRAFT_33616 [Blyttiomyces helicus]
MGGGGGGGGGGGFFSLLRLIASASLITREYVERHLQAAQGGTPSLDFVDIMNDEERVRQHSKALRAGNLPELNYSASQLADLKKVSQERIAADRLRKMGFQPKESMGVRYEDA